MRGVGDPMPFAWSTKAVCPDSFLAVTASFSAPNDLAAEAQVVARSEHGQWMDFIPPPDLRRPHGLHSLRPGTNGCGSARAFGFGLWLEVWLFGRRFRWPIVEGCTRCSLVPPRWPANSFAIAREFEQGFQVRKRNGLARTCLNLHAPIPTVRQI